MSSQIPPKPSLPRMQLTPREKAEKALAVIFEPIDVIGKAVMGDLWKTFCESIRDAIALSLLLQVPSLIGQWILRKEFSGFDVCMIENAWGVNRYACFIIVASDFCLWIVLAGRILSRFLTDLNQLLVKKGGKYANKP
ncbi:hypothetical protein [Trichocoleus sp. FACHB-262]|uniref:hypothetical protein n=1 Tax=Trichocoleus sp. FACHB-262 TaxID=2692869 RepID=UPI0016843130|nr:hypothetical protein [Trichocoleus sp. FACHB-262]MBD2122061.1 hypothetical protein [Trichocoleus sp. FACHB-262]